MRIGWLGGWGIPINYIKNIAEKYINYYTHFVLYPGEKWLIKAQSISCDLWIGYSLGAHLMLRESFGKNGVLICPFSSFNKETNVKYLKRLLKTNFNHALNDFYLKANLSLVCNNVLPYPIQDLNWGLDVLLNPPLNLDYSPFNSYSGSNDLIVQGDGNSIVVSGATHNIEDYISVIKNGI